MKKDKNNKNVRKAKTPGNGGSFLFENKYVHLSLLILVPLLLYFKTIYFDFIYDDLLIKNNAGILGRFGSIIAAFQRDAFFQKPGTTFYRPMQLVTFVSDCMISGPNPWMHHLTNIVIHIASVVSLYYLLCLLRIHKRFAFAAALIFSVHPLVAGGVSWVSSRGDLLLGFFGIWLFITLIYYARSGKLTFLFAHAVCFILAVFSKETAVILPIVLSIFYYVVLRNENKIKRMLLFPGIWTSAILLFFLMKLAYVHESWVQNEFGLYPFIRNLSYFPALISSIIFPVGLPFMPQFDVAATLSGIVLLLSIGFGVYYAILKKWELSVFGVLWFLLLLLPPLLYRQRNFDHDIMQLEQRMYLPLMGMIIAFACFVQQQFTKGKAFLYVFFGAIVIFFPVLTWNHCEDYRNVFNFTSAAIRKNPENSAAYTYRGLAYSEIQEFDKAMEDYDNAIAFSQYTLAYSNRGWLKGLLNDFAGAESDYSVVIKKEPTNLSALMQRAEARRRLQKYDEALTDLSFAKKLDAGNPRIYSSMGWVCNDQHKFQQAVPLFNQSISLAPHESWAYQGRAFANMNLGNLQDVVNDCKTVLQIEPDNIEFYNHLGDAERMLKHYPEAIAAYSSSIERNTSLGESYFFRGLAREALKDTPGAKKDWESALKLGYEPARALLSKY